MFYKRGGLKNLAKFTGKHLCWCLFFIKVAGLRSTTPQVASSEFCFAAAALLRHDIRQCTTVFTFFKTW